MLEKSLTNSQYADSWEKESLEYKKNGLYQKLFELLPQGKVLEFGCGAGFSTEELLKNHEVLSLECNPFLISKASNYLGHKKNCIYKCDFLNLSKRDKQIISDFSPDIIVGCFLGANGLEVLKHVKEKVSVPEKPKLYREKIEDFIVSGEECLKNISTIQLVNRGVLISDSYSDEECKNITINNYNSYVFGKNNFDIVDVSFFDWDYKSIQLDYSAVSDLGSDVPKKSRATSIIAKKVR